MILVADEKFMPHSNLLSLILDRGIAMQNSNQCCQNAVSNLHPMLRDADANARPYQILVCPRNAKRIGRSVAYTAEKLVVADVVDIDFPSWRDVVPLPRRCVTGTGVIPLAPLEHLPTVVARVVIVPGSA